MTSVAMLSESISPSGGGVSVAMQGLSQDLWRSGTDVRIFAGLNGETVLDGWGNIPISLHPIRGVSRIGFLKGATEAINNFNPDLLHLHGLWTPASVSALLTERFNIRRVVSPHGMLDPWALRNSGWKKRIARSLFENCNLKSAALLHALNTNEYEAMRALGFQTPIAIVPNGILLPQLENKPTLPERLNLDSRRILLFLGRIHPKKGLRETIEAWKLALLMNSSFSEDWQLVIAGWDDGNHLPALRTLAKDLGIDAHVRFVGPVFGHEKAGLLGNAECFVLASHSEGLPMAVLEASSYSVPVLMTAGCNFPEGFEAGAALRINSRPEDMSKVLADTMSMPRWELAAIGANGRALVASRYSRAQIADAMRQAYEWAAYGGAVPAHVEIKGL